jgi:aspartyl-tRNA(Asn)/glutamyl-tRNA(Gln) amidotransferase subunit C
MDIKHVAKLANLTVSEDEVKKYGSQLSSVLDLVNKLKKIDTEGVEPTYQVTGQENCWREDEIDTTSMLKLDKKVFKIPKILNHDG